MMSILNRRKSGRGADGLWIGALGVNLLGDRWQVDIAM
jgi:hypothetical protein